MKRFFYLPLMILLLIALIGCACEASGSVTTPTEAPSAVPTSSASPAASSVPTRPASPAASSVPTAPAETTAPVMPTAPIASPSATSGS